MLRKIGLKQISGGINLIDLGSSGQLDSYWSALERFLNLYAFDPNEEECERLSAADNNFASATYIPEAIAGQEGIYTLYKTKNIYCWSLLEPDMNWLSRFDYYDLFTIEETSQIRAKTLGDVEELKGVNIDAIKCDTQGLELPIFLSAPDIIDNAFLVETETGFVENYKGETTFTQISEFMQKKDFLLFGINTSHRVSRNNQFSNKSSNQQILWCEAMWIKDYVAIEQKVGLNIDRAKALKALMLCANHGCIDYGFELSTLFFEKKLITDSEYKSLKDIKGWYLQKPKSSNKIYAGLIKSVIHFLPRRIIRKLGNIFLEVSSKPHPVEIWLRGQRK